MRGTALLVGAILGAVSLVGAPATAVAAAPDPYSGGIQTECNVSVPAGLEAGERIHIRISVDANSPTPPTGKVTLVLLAGPGGGVARAELQEIWSKTVSYNGGTKTVVGPALQAAQRYKVGMRYRPGDDTFLKCSDGALFGVQGVKDHNGPDDNGPGGLLPDTGGPALLWLLLGVGLVGAGGGTVAYSRRRNAPATV